MGVDGNPCFRSIRMDEGTIRGTEACKGTQLGSVQEADIDGMYADGVDAAKVAVAGFRRQGQSRSVRRLLSVLAEDKKVGRRRSWKVMRAVKQMWQLPSRSKMCRSPGASAGGECASARQCIRRAGGAQKTCESWALWPGWRAAGSRRGGSGASSDGESSAAEAQRQGARETNRFGCDHKNVGPGCTRE